MKEELEINSIRCSVFVPKISYSSENIQVLMKLFPGFLPSVIDLIPKQLQVIGIKLEAKNIENQPWQLMSADSLTKIAFYDNKIDVVIAFSQVCRYDLKQLQDVLFKLSGILETIIGEFKFIPTRLAFAPTIVLPLSNNETYIREFTQKIFSINTFDNSPLANCEFNQVYKLDRNLGGQNFVVNHLVRFNTEMVQKIGDVIPNIFPLLKIEMDLNTVSKPEYSFKENAVKDFFEKSVQWCDSLLNLYFS